MAMGRWRRRIAFLADQARKTLHHPARIFTVPYTLSRQRLAPIIPQLSHAPGTPRPDARDTIPISNGEIKPMPGSGHPLGELQGNNYSYLNRNPRPDVSELAKRHKDRRLDNFFIETGMLDRQNLALATRLQRFFQDTDTYRHIAVEDIVRCIVAYREIYLAAPIVHNQYGLNFTSGLCLFVMVRCLGPKMIVESGVYKGLSSYLLASACPTATIHA